MPPRKKPGPAKLSPTIHKLLKAVDSLPVDEAIAALAEAAEDATMDQKLLLLRARVKLLEKAQKPKPAGRKARKKPTPAPVVVEVVEAPAEPEPDPEPEGTITALDIDNLGALFGATDAEDNAQEDPAPAAADKAQPAPGEMPDLSALDALGDDNPTEDAAAPQATDGAAAMDLSALDALGDDTDGAAAETANADEAAIEDAEIIEEPEPEPEPTFTPPEIPVLEDVPKNKFADDATYMQVWSDMLDEMIDNLKAVETSEDPIEKRQGAAFAHSDALHHAARRMHFKPYSDRLWRFITISPKMVTDKILNPNLKSLVADLETLRDGGKLAADAGEALIVPARAKPKPKPKPAAAAKPEPTADPEPEPAAPPQAEAPAPEPVAAEAAPSDANQADAPESEDSGTQTPQEEAMDTATDAGSDDEETPAPAPAAPDGMMDLAAAFAEMGDGEEDAPPADDGFWGFDEDLSEEELAAKQAAADSDLAESDAERPPTHDGGDDAADVAIELPPEPEFDLEPVDGPPLTRFADDEGFMQIWVDMVEDAIENLGITHRSDAPIDARRKNADAHADRLLHAARQMEFSDWVARLEDFAFDCPILETDAALNDAIQALLADIEKLKADMPDAPAPSERTAKPAPAPTPEPAPPSPQTAPEPDPSAPETSQPDAQTPASPQNAELEANDNGVGSDDSDDDFWGFDEDLSPEELAAKNAANTRDLGESAAERPPTHGALADADPFEQTAASEGEKATPAIDPVLVDVENRKVSLDELYRFFPKTD